MGTSPIAKGLRPPLRQTTGGLVGSEGSLLAGSCHGFEVISSIPFRGLRRTAGTGVPLSIVDSDEAATGGRLLQRWERRRGRRPMDLLRADDGGYLIRTESVGTFHVAPDGRTIRIPRAPDRSPLVELLTFGAPAAVSMELSEGLPLHAGAVDVEGRSILFTGPGGTGKTTMAAGFHAAGHRILSDDLSRVDIADATSVSPGPAIFRLRQDSLSVLGTEGVTPIARIGEKAHLSVDAGRRGDGAPVPLAAVILLTPASREPHLSPVPVRRAVAELWTSAFFTPTPEGREACFSRLTRLAASVPVFRLTYRRDLARLRSVVDVVAERVMEW